MNKKLALTLLFITSLSLEAKVYATVGDKNITDTDIAQVLRVIPNGAMIEKYGGIDRLDKAKQKQIIDIAVDNYLLSKKAFQEGIDKTKEYKSELDILKTSLATQIYTNQIISKIKVDEKEIKDFYDKNKKDFTQKSDRVKARHILVKSEKEAESLIDELKKSKDVEKKFIELAKTKSIGPSGKDGGQLGWFEAKRMVPEFSKAAFALKKGEFTKKPVKTQFGYHVIYVEDKINKGAVIGFDKVKNQIAEMIKTQKIKDKINGIIADLRKSNKVTIK